MVLPSALATGGSCCLLLSLFVCATLFFLTPQHVKSLQPLATWIDRSIDFDRSIDGARASGSNVNDTMMRRQWDPGTPTPSTRLRRQWDPGIAKDGIDRPVYLPTSHSNGAVVDRSFYLPMRDSNVVVVTMVRTNRSMRSQVPPADRGNCMLSPVEQLRSMELPADAQLDPIASHRWSLSLNNTHDGASVGLDSASITRLTRNESIDCPASTACLFHYSHPVLSRPTVPNIRHKQHLALANNPHPFWL